jgi:Uncharacterised nucleotidyltransferase
MPQLVTEQPFGKIKETLKRAAGALNDADVPYMLGGGLAVWARGGPATTNDLDLMVRPADAERALEVFEREGMQTERPPEGWLFKAWDDGVLVDVIFRQNGSPVDESLFERAERLEVYGVPMHVMSVNDVMISRLKALDEHELDYERPLEFARALREQIDWRTVREQTRDSPYAKAFFTMVEELGVAPRRHI